MCCACIWGWKVDQPRYSCNVQAGSCRSPALHPQPTHLSPNPPTLLPSPLAAVVRAAAERGAGHAGLGAAAFVAPLLLNLALSLGDNEEVCYCLKVGGSDR